MLLARNRRRAQWSSRPLRFQSRSL
jgi:hypothetical protein